jgi:hypothetical protein
MKKRKLFKVFENRDQCECHFTIEGPLFQVRASHVTAGGYIPLLRARILYFVSVSSDSRKLLAIVFCDVICSDFDHLDAEIANLREQLKPKVNKLRDLEQKDELRGFNLNPLSPQERDAIKNLL